MLLLRQTTVPTVIDPFYLLTLSSYGAFRSFDWILRHLFERHFEPTAVIFGIVQTTIYVDFAWVYSTGQGVRLRGGGVVVPEDLSRGWLVSGLLGWRALPLMKRKKCQAAMYERQQAVRIWKMGIWGAGGILVSADEDATTLDHRRRKCCI